MKNKKINYKKVFKMFVDKMAHPRIFRQKGNYYATDGISAITMPIGVASISWILEQPKPNMDALIPKDFYEGIEINVALLKAEIIKETPLMDGKKIPDKKTIFNFMGSGIAYLQIMRLIQASEMLGEKKIFLIFGGENQKYIFKVGETKILIMNCVNLAKPISLNLKSKIR